jgi:hypothetical protein
MKANLKLLAIFVGYFLMACSCPPDVKLGEIKMINPSFFPLKGGEILRFINDKKEILVLTDSSGKQYPNKLIQATLCQHTPFAIQFSYYEGTPSYDLTYVNTKEHLKIYFYFRTLASAMKDSYYDYFSASIGSPESTNLAIMVSDRGNLNKIDSLTILRFANIKMLKDSVLNGKSYKNIYYDGTKPKIYYSESIGVIAFWFKNQWWYLLQ